MNLNHSPTTETQADASAPMASAAIDAAHRAGDLATQEAARFGEMARHWWQRNAQSALDVASTVRHEAVAMSDRTGRYVRDEPMRSLLVAAVTGALIGGLAMWFGRREPR
jgi:ElaB/YqjD/DUF883 family membrane-anchored ribosome-binding protein